MNYQDLDVHKTAFKCYQNMKDNEDLFRVGHRNNDAVNLCVICYTLGLDPIREFNATRKAGKWNATVNIAYDERDFRDRAEVINKYIEDEWCNSSTLPAYDYSPYIFAFKDEPYMEMVMK